MANVSAQDRRRQFVAAAIEVIAEEGVAKATTRRIAEKAHAPAASIHYCFDSKEELFQAVLESSSYEGLQFAGRDIRPQMGLGAAVEAILRGYLEWMLHDRANQQAQYELTFWALRTTSSQHLPQRNYRRYIDGTAQLLREACRPGEESVDIEFLARHLIAVLDGHTLQWITLDDDAMVRMVDKAIAEIQASLPGVGATAAL